MRRFDRFGVAEAEVIGLGAAPTDDGNDRSLLVPIYRAGELVYRDTLEDARARHVASLAELPRSARRISKGDPAIETIILDATGSETTNPYQAAPLVTNL